MKADVLSGEMEGRADAGYILCIPRLGQADRTQPARRNVEARAVSHSAPASNQGYDPTLLRNSTWPVQRRVQHFNPGQKIKGSKPAREMTQSVWVRVEECAAFSKNGHGIGANENKCW